MTARIGGSVRCPCTHVLPNPAKTRKPASPAPSAAFVYRRLEDALRGKPDVAELLRRVQGMATQSNLTIRGFIPQAVARKQLHMEWPIGLQLEGTYHDLGRFFDRIASMSRLISVSDLQVRTRTNPNGRGTVAVSCVTTTFVFHKDLTLAGPGAQP